MAQATVSLPDDSELILRDDVVASSEDGGSPRDNVRPIRLAFAAAHVVMDEAYASVDHSAERPGDPESIAESIDWDQTFGLRRKLSSYGMGIAEAMDTAQRFEIGWPASRRLIESCAKHAGPMGFIAGAGTDHRSPPTSTTDLIDGVVEQVALIRAAGGTAIVLPMPWLSLQRSDADTYAEVYRAIAREAGGTLLVHWLGAMFLESMDGYFPGDSFDRVMRESPEVYRGAKISLLDAEREESMRRSIAARDQIILTGDDFNFGRLIVGDGAAPERWTELDGRPAALCDASHALLGILDGVARPAAAALRALENGDAASAAGLLSRCEELGRIVFEAPTSRYKVGLAFLAWLNGWQDRFMLPNHLERLRDTDHLLRVVVSANEAGCIEDAPLAADRLRAFLASG